MKQALISPDELVYDYTNSVIGSRIAEVSDQSFEVASPLFWVEVTDEVSADIWYWNGTEALLPPVKPEPPVGTEPVVL